MSSATVAVHGKVVHKRQFRHRASSGGGRALVHLRQLATGRKVKASNLVYFDVVRLAQEFATVAHPLTRRVSFRISRGDFYPYTSARTHVALSSFHARIRGESGDVARRGRVLNTLSLAPKRKNKTQSTTFFVFWLGGYSKREKTLSRR